MAEYIETRQFKANCLKLMDNVHRTKKRIIITKRNKPIAQIMPIKEEGSLFGKMKGTVHILGDILAPVDTVRNISDLQSS